MSAEQLTQHTILFPGSCPIHFLFDEKIRQKLSECANAHNKNFLMSVS